MQLFVDIVQGVVQVCQSLNLPFQFLCFLLLLHQQFIVTLHRLCELIIVGVQYGLELLNPLT